LNIRWWGRFSQSMLGLAILMLVSASLVGQETGIDRTLRVALSAEPDGLDMTMSTSITASIPARHLVEGLFAFDEEYAPQPMLVETWMLSEDELTATFYLRHGVRFHNGEEMLSNDVVSSLNRWGEIGLSASALWTHIDEIRAVNEYTVQMEFNAPFGALTTHLANLYGGPRIYPQEIASKYSTTQIPPAEIIGTGPYRLSSWESGESIRLERFPEYVMSSSPPSGFAGRKEATFDVLQFYFIPDNIVRFIGIESGAYDYAVDLPSRFLAEIDGNPEIRPILTNHPPIYAIALLNNRSGPLTDPALKRALITALDMEALMSAGYGDPAFWNLNPSYFAPGIRWHTADAGIELYNAADPEKARDMAIAAGYSGEIIRLLVAQDMTAQYNQALEMSDQLRAAGFRVVLQVFDRATFFEIRNSKTDLVNPVWDIAFSFYSTIPDPSLVLMLNPSYAGWWDSHEIQQLRGSLNVLASFTDRYAIWEDVMDLWYSQIPAIKFGDAFQLHLIRSDITGYGADGALPMLSPYFWNSQRR